MVKIMLKVDEWIKLKTKLIKNRMQSWIEIDLHYKQHENDFVLIPR